MKQPQALAENSQHLDDVCGHIIRHAVRLGLDENVRVLAFEYFKLAWGCESFKQAAMQMSDNGSSEAAAALVEACRAQGHIRTLKVRVFSVLVWSQLRSLSGHIARAVKLQSVQPD